MVDEKRKVELLAELNIIQIDEKLEKFDKAKALADYEKHLDETYKNLLEIKDKYAHAKTMQDIQMATMTKEQIKEFIKQQKHKK